MGSLPLHGSVDEGSKNEATRISKRSEKFTIDSTKFGFVNPRVYFWQYVSRSMDQTVYLAGKVGRQKNWARPDKLRQIVDKARVKLSEVV